MSLTLDTKKSESYVFNANPLLAGGRKLSIEIADKSRKQVIILSLTSITTLLALGIATFYLSAITNNNACFAFSLDMFLDSLSSVVVLWRFWSSATTFYSNQREKQACVGLAVLFFASAVSIILRCLEAFTVREESDEDPDELWYWIAASAPICTIMAFAKFYLGFVVESQSVITDGVNSLVGALMAYAILANYYIVIWDPNIWYLDPLVGMLCAIFLALWGAKLLFENVTMELFSSTTKYSLQNPAGTKI